MNLYVVTAFAYLHDSCRISDAVDIEHGARASKLVDEIRQTFLKHFTDDEIAQLKSACQLHTVAHKTGDLTIDTCFDADRLDLFRCGIMPEASRMATERGAAFADDYRAFRKKQMLWCFRRAKLIRYHAS